MFEVDVWVPGAPVVIKGGTVPEHRRPRIATGQHYCRIGLPTNYRYEWFACKGYQPDGSLLFEYESST